MLKPVPEPEQIELVLEIRLSDPRVHLIAHVVRGGAGAQGRHGGQIGAGQGGVGGVLEMSVGSHRNDPGLTAEGIRKRKEDGHT